MGIVTPTPLSKGVLVAGLEALIRQGQEYLRAFAEGRTVFIGYLVPFRDHIQHCLLDIEKDLAGGELREIATLDLTIAEGLARYYALGVYNDFDVKDGDPSEFLRLQKEYDLATPPKIRRMIELLSHVRDKMLLGPARARQGPQSGTRKRTRHRGGDPHKPYSDRDAALYNTIKEDLPRMTNAVLLKHLWPTWKKENPGRTKAALRNMLCRIRKHHDIPAPKP